MKKSSVECSLQKNILTITDGVVVVNLVAVVACAHKASERVGASSILTNVIHLCTLINVLKNHL